mmetsp:Transcript_5752/g.7086  ORF Transcript_5752/g.7086 Transcript_5752/m.7086 type:complete len:389 (-) Transcript_5752:194-1360(-)
MVSPNKQTISAKKTSKSKSLLASIVVLGVTCGSLSYNKDAILQGIMNQQLVSSSSSVANVNQARQQRNVQEYVAASTEEYIMHHLDDLNLRDDKTRAKGCKIWFDPEATTQETYHNLRSYRDEIDVYAKAIKDFSKLVPNLVETIRRGGSAGTTNQEILCKTVRPHPDGIQALFPSKQLSLTPAGYAEPLLTPMRHPSFCEEDHHINKLRTDYLVHDYEQMCLNLKPHSKTIFVDMGASLEFHNEEVDPPVMALLNEFEKFGFHFDHIYAFEITQTDPNKVYRELLPEKYFPSYHWINTGVSAEVEDRLNPLKSIISRFDEDDLIIVKLDIDTGSIEVPMANQLLEDESISKLVDLFYFESHGFMKANAGFNLIHGLREKGVAAHFWV